MKRDMIIDQQTIQNITFSYIIIPLILNRFSLFFQFAFICWRICSIIIRLS